MRGLIYFLVSILRRYIATPRYLVWMLERAGLLHIMIRYWYVKDKVKTQNATILDVGCNIGWLAFNKNPSATYIGLDTDSLLVKVAKEICKMKDVHFVLADARRMCFRDHVFDRVFCLEVLEHIEDEYSVLTELSRVIKPKAYLILSTPTPSFDTVIPRHVTGHVRKGYTLCELKQRLLSKGFRLIDFQYHTKGLGSAILKIYYKLLTSPHQLAWYLRLLLLPLLLALSRLDIFWGNNGVGVMIGAQKLFGGGE